MPVIEKFHINGGFLFKEAIGSNSWECIGYEIIEDRCLECSIWAIFFNSSLTVSITALFLIRILSFIFINTFFMLFLILVINWMPSTNRVSNKDWPIYPLSAHNFPYNVVQEWTLLQRLPVIHISWCKHEVQYFSFVIDNQV